MEFCGGFKKGGEKGPFTEMPRKKEGNDRAGKEMGENSITRSDVRRQYSNPFFCSILPYLACCFCDIHVRENAQEILLFLLQASHLQAGDCLLQDAGEADAVERAVPAAGAEGEAATAAAAAAAAVAGHGHPGRGPCVRRRSCSCSGRQAQAGSKAAGAAAGAAGGLQGNTNTHFPHLHSRPQYFCRIFSKVATRLENPTKYHMLESQRRQVKEFLAESPGSSAASGMAAAAAAAANAGNLLSPPPQHQQAKSAPDYQVRIQFITK